MRALALLAGAAAALLPLPEPVGPMPTPPPQDRTAAPREQSEFRELLTRRESLRSEISRLERELLTVEGRMEELWLASGREVPPRHRPAPEPGHDSGAPQEPQDGTGGRIAPTTPPRHSGEHTRPHEQPVEPVDELEPPDEQEPAPPRDGTGGSAFEPPEDQPPPADRGDATPPVPGGQPITGQELEGWSPLLPTQGWGEALPAGFNAPGIPSYRIPTAEDCDWVIEAGVATSQKGLGSIPANANGDMIGAAFKASIAAGHSQPVRFGVWDDGGSAVVGGLYSWQAAHSVATSSRYSQLAIEIVGLDDECEVNLGWTDHYGDPVYVGAFNIGLRGPSDSFVIRTLGACETVILDGCWWLPSKTYGPNQKHKSGIHIDEWETFIWRDHKWRGEKPTDPGIRLYEHSAYLKSCVGDASDPTHGTWIVGCDLKGGNRTGVQERPGAAYIDPKYKGNPRPQCPIVVAYNRSDGYGWDHGSDKATSDGGYHLTIWASPDAPAYVFRNDFRDARYGCLNLSPQSNPRNYFNANGYPIHSIHLWANSFENSRGDRGCVSLTGVEEVHLYPGNSFQGPEHGDLTIDSPWVWAETGIPSIPVGRIYAHGAETLGWLRSIDVRTWDPNRPRKARPMPAPYFDTIILVP